MEEKLKRLTTKFFIEQKTEEIFKFIVFGFAGYFFLGVLPFLLGRWVDSVLWNTPKDPGIWFFYWFAGMIFCIVVFAAYVFLEDILKRWINSNWHKAERRARAQLSKKGGEKE